MLADAQVVTPCSLAAAQPALSGEHLPQCAAQRSDGNGLTGCHRDSALSIS
jgi:hypothetical protein